MPYRAIVFGTSEPQVAPLKSIDLGAPTTEVSGRAAQPCDCRPVSSAVGLRLED